MNTTHFKKLERMYLQANVNTMVFNSTSCNIKGGEAEIGLTTPFEPRVRRALTGAETIIGTA